jgi:hypothetical protein
MRYEGAGHVPDQNREFVMSLQNVKKMADLKERISQGSEKLRKIHDENRKSITDEVMAEFESYMSSNGFAVSSTARGKKAIYKDIAVELRPGTEAYVGAYHSFDLLVPGKEVYIRVLASFENSQRNQSFVSSSELEQLEKELDRIESFLENPKLESYTFESGIQSRAPQKPQRFKSKTIAEIIDHFTA